MLLLSAREEHCLKDYHASCRARIQKVSERSAGREKINPIHDAIERDPAEEARNEERSSSQQLACKKARRTYTKSGEPPPWLYRRQKGEKDTGKGIQKSIRMKKTSQEGWRGV